MGLGAMRVLTVMANGEAITRGAAPPRGPNGYCVLLVSSDGLHGAVGEDDISDAFRGTRGVDEACRRLVTLAFDRGSTDNVSIAAVEVGHLPRLA